MNASHATKPTMSTTAIQDEQIAIATRRHDEAIEELRALSGANPTDAPLANHFALGTASWSTAFIWGRLVVQLTFTGTGEKLVFNSDYWGVGFGGGVAAGAAVFSVPPSDLLSSDCDFVLTNSALLPVVVTFWRAGRLLGTFTGPVLNAGFGTVGNRGRWTRA